ncbi:pyridoxamine 5'-phosphate oxidase family protein [Anaerovorax odorimutans]|uniref:pyridoxamine 5'-phosphate oxidase family protein n=1 Tax=Anaerovorax odorimutans TaxID=109327 RepID=UPI0004289AE1|nr:pyridoxamine 5'-phosphate oxidase family protein [Anaerovorax odorimutans]
MCREMRRKDRLLSEIEIDEIMRNSEYGILSTVGEKEVPYGIPLNYVYKDGNIYFHCALTGHKLDNIKFNNSVSFCVVNDVKLIAESFTTKFKSVICFGKVDEVSGEKKQEIFISLIEKFSGDFKEEGIEYIKKVGDKAKIFCIKVDYMTGKGNK